MTGLYFTRAFMKTLFITGQISENGLWSRTSETHDAHVSGVTSVTYEAGDRGRRRGSFDVNTVLRGLRAMGTAAALAVGLSAVGLIVGPAAVANTVTVSYTHLTLPTNRE